MKPIFIFIVLLCVVNCSMAQTFNEWFRQKQTQKKYLIQQIAALHVYAGYVEKGYNIARKGTNVIGSIKKGDINLHTNYFNSLKNVGPAVGQYARVADIIRLQLEIVSVRKNTTKQIRQNSQVTPEEVQYIDKIYINLVQQSAALMDDLIWITTSGKLEMKDDERLKRIDGLYTQMQDLRDFAQSFSSQAKTLLIQRQKDQNNIQTTRLLHGIK